MRNKLVILLCLLLTAVGLSAQERVITGVVTDSDVADDVLPGATVSVVDGKHVSEGTVTDFEGKFTLKA